MISVDEKQTSDRALVGPALRSFFRICEMWSLSDEQQRLLLGSPEKTAFEIWKQHEPSELPADAFLRISHLLAIYKALHTIFSKPSQADTWIARPNSATMFCGRPAIDLMINGNIECLEMVRSYLEAQIS